MMRKVDNELLICVSNYDIAGVKEAIEAGADVNATGSIGMTPLSIAISSFHDNAFDLIKLLVDAGADINKASENRLGITPLMRAVTNNKINVVRFLLEKGADINKRNNHGETALMLASYFNHRVNIVKLLLEHGADVSIKDEKGFTALDVAIQSGKCIIADVLRSHMLEQKLKNLM